MKINNSSYHESCDKETRGGKTLVRMVWGNFSGKNLFVPQSARCQCDFNNGHKMAYLSNFGQFLASKWVKMTGSIVATIGSLNPSGTHVNITNMFSMEI